jgi:universal stress protein A
MKTNVFKSGKVVPELPGTMDVIDPAENMPGVVPTPLKLQKILVPIDFSDCSLHALSFALGFAEHFRAHLVLFHVVEATMHSGNLTGMSASFDEANQNLVATARERLEDLVRRYRTGMEVETLVRIGHAHSEITDTANALGSDLIIIATHGYSGFKPALLGSTTEKIIRHASCPVLTVHAPPNS